MTAIPSDILGRHQGHSNCETRLLRGTVVMFLLVFGVHLLAGADEKKPRTLDADRITLRDKDGKIKLLLEVSDKGEPSLKLFGSRESPEIEASVSQKDGSLIYVNSPIGKGGIRILSNPFGSSQVDMTDQRDKMRLSLLVAGQPQDSAELAVYDADERQRLILTVLKDGDSDIYMMDEDRKRRIGIGLSQANESSIDFADKNTVHRMRLSGQNDGSVAIRFQNEKGEATSQIPISK
jgi:hypothetical protein